jgi:hypothetical protein
MSGGRVAVVGIPGEKLPLAKELGADIVIDARAENPAEALDQSELRIQAASQRQRGHLRGHARPGPGEARPWFLTASIESRAACGSRYWPPRASGRMSGPS